MTRERAIEVLKAWDLNWSDSFTANEFEQAFAVAISALSENKTQMIDKSNFDAEQYKTDLQSAYDCGYNKALSENKGEWIHDKSDWKYRFNCSKCGYKLFEEKTNYCPNCGARMKGGE